MTVVRPSSRSERCVKKHGELTDLLVSSWRTPGGWQGGPPEIRLPTRVEPNLDGQAIVRLDSEYNHVMRGVAQAYRADVIDGASILESTPGVFVDVCHFNATGRYRIGQTLAPTISRILSEAKAR